MRLFRTIALAAVAALILGACGGGEDHSEHQPEGAATASDGHTDHGHEGFLFGEPGEAGDVTESIEVTAKDFEFEPNELTVNQGDVIEFKVTNEGEQDHEFVLGDAALMEEMSAAAHEHTSDDPNAVPRMSPGDEGSIIWAFTKPGRFRFECHIDAHHKLGMTGTITVMGN